MIMPHLPGKYKEVLSCLICARSCWTWTRTRAAHLGRPGGQGRFGGHFLDHAYGEGLYAVSDYLYEVQEKIRETWTCAWHRCGFI